MPRDAFDRVREIALALPEVNERLSHGAPCFYFRDKRPICYFHSGDFASDGRASLWCPAAPGRQAELIATNSKRFFAPTPSASGVFRDWIGVYVEETSVTDPVWDEVTAVLHDAFRQVAPQKLSAQLGL